MNIHKIILPYTPQSIKEFFSDIARIEDKIANGEDYYNEIKKVDNESEKVCKRIRTKSRVA